MSESRLVYSTAGNNLCPACRQARQKCRCPDAASKTPAADTDGVRIQRQSKGRGGKQVTVISGLQLNASDMKSLLKDLKAGIGSGGTVKGAVLEIQGDRREQLLQLLAARGIEAKLSGG